MAGCRRSQSSVRYAVSRSASTICEKSSRGSPIVIDKYYAEHCVGAAPASKIMRKPHKLRSAQMRFRSNIRADVLSKI
jgi:hypothetical protein